MIVFPQITLLLQVLTQVLASKRDLPIKQRTNSARDELQCLARVTETVKAIVAIKKHEENQAISGPGDDEENQLPSKQGIPRSCYRLPW